MPRFIKVELSENEIVAIASGFENRNLSLLPADERPMFRDICDGTMETLEKLVYDALKAARDGQHDNLIQAAVVDARCHRLAVYSRQS